MSVYDEATDAVRTHVITVSASAAGYGWGCSCGASGKGAGTKTPRGARAAADRHLQAAWTRAISAAQERRPEPLKPRTIHFGRSTL